MKINEDEQKKYYKDNPDKFKEVKVKIIYIAFNSAPTPGKARERQKGAYRSRGEGKIDDSRRRSRTERISARWRVNSPTTRLGRPRMATSASLSG